jgi:hypothetical protein
MSWHLIFLYLITLIILGEEYKLWSSSLRRFLQPPVTSSLFSILRPCGTTRKSGMIPGVRSVETTTAGLWRRPLTSNYRQVKNASAYCIYPLPYAP